MAAVDLHTLRVGGVGSPSNYEVVQTFAAAHPDVYGGCWFDGPQLHVGLTVMRPHARTLRALLPDPASVTIRPVRFTAVEIAAVAVEVDGVVRRSGVTWHSLGGGLRAATADLGPEGSVLAGELHDRFGDRLRITVGGRVYPPDGRAVAPLPAPVATEDLPGLQLRAVLDSPHVVTGRVFQGTVHLLNAGETSIRFDTDQPLIAVVIDTADVVVGTFSGWRAGTGIVVDLAPGDTQEIAFTGGTAGGSGDRYATAPGPYAVVVALPVRAAGRGRFVTAPVPLVVTPES